MSISKVSALLIILLAAASANGADIDTIGATLLRQVSPGLTGNGISVGQVEAPISAGTPPPFEVNPGAAGVNQPTNLFTWISSSGTAITFTNTVGTESGHADAVAGNFYGNTTNGVAPGVAHVDNYEANFFSDNYIASPQAIPDRVVNQSFVYDADVNGTHYPSNVEATIDSEYDDAATQYGVLFVSGAGNAGTVYPAATCYNGIGVGVYPGNSSTAPTYNGRSKPDLVAPGGGVTSFSTPLVAGSAALLIQAALRGDGGSDTASASDNRTIKALILNGAIKPAGWTNGVTTPLGARYGAGVLNVWNAWGQLAGGKRAFIESTSVLDGQPHPPGSNPGNVPVLTGWDLNSITSPDPLHDKINHYYFNLTGSHVYTLTATLTWQRPHTVVPAQPMSINDLNLFLYNTANGNLVLCSTSMVDNVEHLTLPSLPPGRYDLQVQKNPNGEVSPSETYALAFEFFNIALTVRQTNNNNLVISWPLAPQGFKLASSSSINPSATWAPVTSPVTADTSANRDVVTVPMTGAVQFFRLQRP